MEIAIPTTLLRRLRDVVITSPAAGDVPTYDGSKWVNQPGGGGGGGVSPTIAYTTVTKTLGATANAINWNYDGITWADQYGGALTAPSWITPAAEALYLTASGLFLTSAYVTFGVTVAGQGKDFNINHGLINSPNFAVNGSQANLQFQDFINGTISGSPAPGVDISVWVNGPAVGSIATGDVSVTIGIAKVG